MANSSQSSDAPAPPAVGTVIDGGALKLAAILGYGGYGVVYRAVTTFGEPATYAVKCLPHSTKRSATRQRSLHMREITLHQLASAHPNVVTLHRVIEDHYYTYIVMDYCGDGDLFTQILHQRRYLGHNELIKEVFLQLLDAVDYCHSLNIYHRDLKPENVLCFDNGLRLAITDFGLATTDKMSTEFRTGSVYHMSPECQSEYFAPNRSYSPRFNDIWSLGIILLNLITGRNPWKSASQDDCTFQAYLKDPVHFLPTVLPISAELNYVLTRALEVDWRRRISLQELRMAVMSIDNFYASDVIFEDSMARCPWEAGTSVDGDSESSVEADPEPRDLPQEQYDYASHWSGDSDSEMVFASRSAADGTVWAVDRSSWNTSASFDARCEMDEYGRSMSPSPTPSSSSLFRTSGTSDAVPTPNPPSCYSTLASSPTPSPPVTPNNPGDSWGQPANMRASQALTLVTSGIKPSNYRNSITMLSARSSSMHTALELGAYGYSSSFFQASTEPSKAASLMFDSREDIGMIRTPTNERDEMDTQSMYTYPTISDTDVDASWLASSLAPARQESPVLGVDTDLHMQSPTTVAPTDYSWDHLYASHTTTSPSDPTTPFSFLYMSDVASPQSDGPAHAFSFFPSMSPSSSHSARTMHGTTFLAGPPSPLPLPIRPPQERCPRTCSRKTHTSGFLKPIRLAFPRSSHSPARNAGSEQEPSLSAFGTSWAVSRSTSPSPHPYRCMVPPTKTFTTLTEQHGERRRRRLRSARDWFSPVKLFSAVLA